MFPQFSTNQQEPQQFNALNFARPIQHKQAMNALAGLMNDPAKTAAKATLAGGLAGGGVGGNPVPMNTKGASGDGWLKYTNSGATRNQPIDDKLINAMSFLPEMGVEMRVYSGGQDAAGPNARRTGSTRHDHGNAADVLFFKDGRQLDWANPQDRPIFETIVEQAKARGVTGIGAGPGYMQPGSMHVGFGPEAVWGAGGKGANAPQWLTDASQRGKSARAETLAALGL